MAVLEITESGYFILRRADYIQRNERSRISSDGDIILGKIDPQAYIDNADAKEIIAWINANLAPSP
jgi:hypothetical protein